MKSDEAIQCIPENAFKKASQRLITRSKDFIASHGDYSEN